MVVENWYSVGEKGYYGVLNDGFNGHNGPHKYSSLFCLVRMGIIFAGVIGWPEYIYPEPVSE